jgi:hypothetical protein
MELVHLIARFSYWWSLAQLEFLLKLYLKEIILKVFLYEFGHAVTRHYATSQKVAGSIPNEVIGFFN